MRICFTLFLICGLGEPNIYHQSVCFTRNGDFTWRASDCEELVGVTWRVFRQWDDCPSCSVVKVWE